jgi:hypothetical protein
MRHQEKYRAKIANRVLVIQVATSIARSGLSAPDMWKQMDRKVDALQKQKRSSLGKKLGRLLLD